MKKDNLKYIAIIPARYASTRFPGKPLVQLGGKPIIQRVYERVKCVFDELCVATDDERIAQCVASFGGRVVMTGTHHKSGTDRCFEALTKMEGHYDVVVNVQGDEPFIDGSQLEAIKACFDDDATQIATLVKPFAPGATWDELSNPNTPKVVMDQQGYALYFSRSVIPFLRGVDKQEWTQRHAYYKHIGLYAYRTAVLEHITKMEQGTLELAESLEQLRWLQAGLKIKTGVTNVETIGIDTPEDLKRAEMFLAEMQGNQ